MDSFYCCCVENTLLTCTFHLFVFFLGFGIREVLFIEFVWQYPCLQCYKTFLGLESFVFKCFIEFTLEIYTLDTSVMAVDLLLLKSSSSSSNSFYFQSCFYTSISTFAFMLTSYYINMGQGTFTC
jgi:hypothetical protein